MIIFRFTMKEFELFYYHKNFIIKYNVYIVFVHYINNEIKNYLPL